MENRQSALLGSLYINIVLTGYPFAGFLPNLASLLEDDWYLPMSALVLAVEEAYQSDSLSTPMSGLLLCCR